MTAGFDALVHAHHARVWRAARRIVKNDADALDVAQQVFLALVEGRIQLDGAADAGAVLAWFAARGALMHLRRDSRRLRTEKQMDPANPSDVRIDPDVREAVARAKAELPDALRVAVELRFQEAMGFAEIGRAMDCSDATAHDRVKQGLDRMRRTLARAGIAGLALEAQLRALEEPDVPAPPLDLEASLLKLAPASAGFVAGALAPALLVVAVIASGLVAARWIEPAKVATEAAVAQVPPVAPTPPMPSSGSPPQRAAPPVTTAPIAAESKSGRLRGRVFDSNGQPMSGVEVRATSRAMTGKDVKFLRRGTTGADGAYAIEVPVARADGEDLRVDVRFEEAFLGLGPDLRVHAGETLDVEPIRLELALSEKDADFELKIALAHPDGTPAGGAFVRIYRLLPQAGREPYAKLETGATADAQGRATLAGHRLGPKRLEVGVQKDGYTEYRFDLSVDAAAGPERSFTLEGGEHWNLVGGVYVKVGGEQRKDAATLRGRCLDAATGAPLVDLFHMVDVIELGAGDDAAFWLDAAPCHVFAPSRQVEWIDDGHEPDERFELHVAPAKRLLIAGRQDDFASAIAGPFELAPSQVQDGVELRFARPCSVEGTVLDVGGAPLAGAFVVPIGSGPVSDAALAEYDQDIRAAAGEGTTWFVAARTDAAGHFVLAGLPPAFALRLAALHPSREPAIGEFLRTGESGSTTGAGGLRFARTRVR